MQMLPFPTYLKSPRQRPDNPHQFDEGPSGFGRLALALTIVAGVLAALQIAAAKQNTGTKSSIASLERQEIQP